MQAARAAAALRKEGIEVTLAKGHYGELTVLVDGKEVISAGPLAAVGVLPSVQEIRDAVVAAKAAQSKDA